MVRWGLLAWTALLHTWLTFSIVAFVLAIVFAVVKRGNLLASDDPYILAGIVAGVCAIFALLGSMAGGFRGALLRQVAVYFSVLFGLSGLLIVVDATCQMGEGQGIPTFLAVVIAVSGAVAYPLLRIPLTMLAIVLASIPGVLYAIGFCCAAIAVRTRSS
jgi:hypothetical protein